MRLGLEPVAQPYPYAITPASGTNAFQQPSGSLLQLSQNGSGGGTMQMSSTSSDDDAGVGDSNFDKSSCHAAEADTAEPRNDNDEPDTPDVGRDRREGSVSAGIDPVTANNSVTDESNAGIVICGSTVTSSSPNSNGNGNEENNSCAQAPRSRFLRGPPHASPVHVQLVCPPSSTLPPNVFSFPLIVSD